MSNPTSGSENGHPIATNMKAAAASNLLKRFGPAFLAVLASSLLLLSLKLPLWQMRLEAPQYREAEALKIAVHPNALRGDLREITVLNQYIGVHVPPTLPQFKWLPAVLVTGAAITLVTCLLKGRPRFYSLSLIATWLALALVVAAVQAKLQIHDIGHRRDHKTILAGIQDFTPPFLGTSRIAQFTVTSKFGLGGWLIGLALVSQVTAAALSHKPSISKTRTDSRAPLLSRTAAVTLSSIS